jgi:hypothetical protein
LPLRLRGEVRHRRQQALVGTLGPVGRRRIFIS